MTIPKLQKLSEKYGTIAYQMLMLLELAPFLLYSIGPNESNDARHLFLISSKQNSWVE